MTEKKMTEQKKRKRKRRRTKVEVRIKTKKITVHFTLNSEGK